MCDQHLSINVDFLLIPCSHIPCSSSVTMWTKIFYIIIARVCFFLFKLKLIMLFSFKAVTALVHFYDGDWYNKTYFQNMLTKNIRLHLLIME